MHIDSTDPTDPTEPTEPAATPPTPAAVATTPEPAIDAVEPAAEPAAPTTPPDPAQERAIALDALSWCREHPSEETAVETLNAVFTLIRDPEVRPAWIAAVRVVVLAIAQVPDPTPALHAHMTVLVANLLELSTDSAMVDELLVAWLRHPKSFGSLHTTPAAFQRESFVQRLGDLLGWNALELHRDRDALRRFAEWINTWNPRNKFRSRRALQALARNFPASDVWSRIHFPSDNGPPPRASHPGRRDHDRPNPIAAPTPAPDAAPAADAPADGAGTALGATPAAGEAGDPTKRKRRRRRRRKGARPGEAGATAEGAAAAEGGADEGPDDGPDDGPADAPEATAAN
jgi:hypothetical protein